MKLVRTLKNTLSNDDAGTELLWSNSFEYTEKASAVLAENNSGVMKVAAGASNVSIPLGAVTTARILALAYDKDLTLKLNGGSETITLKAPTSGKGVFHLEGSITAASLTNAGTADATVQFLLAGV